MNISGLNCSGANVGFCANPKRAVKTIESAIVKAGERKGQINLHADIWTREGNHLVAKNKDGKAVFVKRMRGVQEKIVDTANDLKAKIFKKPVKIEQSVQKTKKALPIEAAIDSKTGRLNLNDTRIWQQEGNHLVARDKDGVARYVKKMWSSGKEYKNA